VFRCSALLFCSRLVRLGYAFFSSPFCAPPKPRPWTNLPYVALRFFRFGRGALPKRKEQSPSGREPLFLIAFSDWTPSGCGVRRFPFRVSFLPCISLFSSFHIFFFSPPSRAEKKIKISFFQTPLFRFFKVDRVLFFLFKCCGASRYGVPVCPITTPSFPLFV